MSNKHRNICTALNYIWFLLILASKVAECLYISAFAFLVGIPIRIASFPVWLKLCAITVEIKKFNSVINKTKGSTTK